MDSFDQLAVGLRSSTLPDGSSVNIWCTDATYDELIEALEKVLEPAVDNQIPLRMFWIQFTDNKIQPSGWIALYSPLDENTKVIHPDYPDHACGSTCQARVLVTMVNSTKLTATCKLLDCISSQNASQDNSKSNGHSHEQEDHPLDKIKTDEEAGSSQQMQCKEDSNTSDEDEIETPRGQKIEEDSGTFEVDLTTLYPVEHQTRLINLDPTVRALTLLRKYTYLRYPWDSEEADEYVGDLSGRMELVGELQNLSQRHQKKIFGLFAEGNVINRRLEEYRSQLRMSDLDFQRKEVLKLHSIKLQFELRQLEFEFKKYQNPLFRELIMSGLAEVYDEQDLFRETVFVVLNDLTCRGALLSVITNIMRGRNLDLNACRFSDDFQLILNKCQVGSTILLGPGLHRIQSIGNIGKGGTILGLHDAIIKSTEVGDNWIVIAPEAGNSVCLENLTVEVAAVEVKEYQESLNVSNDGFYHCKTAAYPTSILIQSGTLNLKNVAIKGTRPVCRTPLSPSFNSPKTEAIRALRGASICAEGLTIDKFHHCIIIGQEVTGKLQQCTLTTCEIGLQIESELVELDEFVVHDYSIIDAQYVSHPEPQLEQLQLQEAE